MEAEIDNDLKTYMRVRMALFNAHEMEARIFFEAVLQPPEALYDQISVLKEEFDALNKTLYRQILHSIQLREGITEEDALSYFTMLQDMFNSSFSSRNCRNISLSDKMDVHERDLPKLLDCMLYGIARRKNE